MACAAERQGLRTYSAGEIVDAFRQTEIVPVRQTWALTIGESWTRTHGPIWAGTVPDYRSEGERELPCGCALVALVRAAGVSPEGLGDIEAFAGALDTTIYHAEGIMSGWDDARAGEDSPYHDARVVGDFGLGYHAGWEAYREVYRARGGE